MKKIIINEHIEKTLFQHLLNEKASLNKVSIVVDFLDKNFNRADIPLINDEGMMENKLVVVWVDMHQNPLKTLTDEQLFYVLQEKFKNIDSDKYSRDTFLKKLIKSWYYKKISKYGSIIDF